MQIGALVNHGGIPPWAAIYWSLISVHIPAGHHTVCWRPFTSRWIYSHLTVCGFWLLLLLVVRTIVICASWVIFSVAVLDASWWTDWCLCCCCVPANDTFDEAPIDRLGSDPLLPCSGVSVFMIYCCGNEEEEDDNEKKGEVLTNMEFASSEYGISNS